MGSKAGCGARNLARELREVRRARLKRSRHSQEELRVCNSALSRAKIDNARCEKWGTARDDKALERKSLVPLLPQS